MAKYLHFTNAANYLYISQQALSDQIRRLESELNVQLFIRKPVLKLTPAGELLQSTLYEIRHVENSFLAKLNDLENVTTGEINIGMHSGRARILMPEILEAFYKKYPNVTVHITSEQTRVYSRLLTEGEFDFYFGINAKTAGETEEDVIAFEPMYLAICRSAVQKVFGYNYEDKLPELRHGADVAAFQDIPFIFASDISQGQSAINSYLLRRGCRLTPALILNDYIVQYRLLLILDGASFCYKSLVPLIHQYNRTLPDGEEIFTFPLADFQENLKLSLIRYRKVFFPTYTQFFYDLTKKSLIHLLDDVSDE